MRYISIFFVLVIIASFVIVQPIKADTRYVGDQLIIMLRQGKSTKHKILKTLETGTPVEVLEVDSSYYKVRTSDGTEGYVLGQYISSNPPKTQRIDELKIEKSALQKKIKELEKTKNFLEMQMKGIEEKYSNEFSNLNTKSTDVEQNLAQALSNESAITEKYNTLVAQAENVVEIAKERDKLLLENKKLTSDFKKLQSKKEKFPDPRMIKWLLAGGGIFFFGWIIGKISRKKRSRF
jgi:SH3 domain protein